MLFNSGANLDPFEVAPTVVQSSNDLMEIDDKNVKRKSENEAAATPLFPFRPEITIEFEDDEAQSEDDEAESEDDEAESEDDEAEFEDDEAGSNDDEFDEVSL